MFSNGKFKNIVAEADVQKQVGSNENFHFSYPMLPVRGATKNWIAVEGALFNSSSSHDTNLIALNSRLASSAPRGPQSHDEKNVFAIYVSYYVKVKLSLGSMGGEMSLKLPFILGNIELDVNSTPSPGPSASTTCDGSGGGGGNNERKGPPPSPSATSSYVKSQQSREEITTVKEIETKLKLSETYKSENLDMVMDDEIIQVHYESSSTSKMERFKNPQFNRTMHESVDVESDELNEIAPAAAVLTQSDSIKSIPELQDVSSNGVTGMTAMSNVVTAQVHHHEYQRDSSDEAPSKS